MYDSDKIQKCNRKYLKIWLIECQSLKSAITPNYMLQYEITSIMFTHLCFLEDFLSNHWELCRPPHNTTSLAGDTEVVGILKVIYDKTGDVVPMQGYV